MGTWSAGNFDNDGALDYAGGLVSSFAARIEAILSDEVMSRLDEDGERILMPSAELISVLCERSGCAPPQPAAIASWQERYLAIFDVQIEGLAGEGYAQERRAVIVQTFETLHQRAREFWDD